MSYKLKKKLLTVIVVIILVFIMVFVFAGTKASADTNLRVNERKYFTSYVVESGDTLWDIAGKYMTREYRDRNEYIREVAVTNQMNSDELRPGQLLLLPYYADAPKYADH